MTNWEKEKARCKKRADELAAEMDQTIETADAERFDVAYQTAKRYMPHSERVSYYKRFLATMIGGSAT